MGIRNPSSADMKSAIYYLESGIHGLKSRIQGRFPFNPKFRKFRLVHQMERTNSVWSDRNVNSGPALKVVHFDRSSHFDLSDWNVPFRLTKFLSTVSLFCILLTRTITKRAVAWVGSVRNVPFYWGRGSSESSNRNFTLVYPRLPWITLQERKIMKYDIWLHISYGHIYHIFGPNIQGMFSRK